VETLTLHVGFLRPAREEAPSQQAPQPQDRAATKTLASEGHSFLRGSQEVDDMAGSGVTGWDPVSAATLSNRPRGSSPRVFEMRRETTAGGQEERSRREPRKCRKTGYRTT
jgi:hypothetical protein